MRTYMMKLRKAVCLLPVMILIVLCGISPVCASSESSRETLRFPGTGFEIDLPPASEISGTLQIACDTRIDEDVRLAMLYYIAVPKEKSEFITQNKYAYSSELDALTEGLTPCLLTVLSLDNGKTLDDLHPEYKKQFEVEYFEELGSAGEHNFYIRYIPEGYDFAWKMSAESKQEFESLVEICREPGRIRLFEPGKESLPPVVFETVDLNGEEIHSEDLFGSHALTMLNIWTTWCGPCISELPDLEKLTRNWKLKEKNVAIVGIVMDIRDPAGSEMISKARDILSEKGVHYINLIPWEGIESMLPVSAFPTNYFIDSKGQIIGECEIGSHIRSVYINLINQKLTEAE